MDRHEEVWLDEFVSRGTTFGRRGLAEVRWCLGSAGTDIRLTA